MAEIDDIRSLNDGDLSEELDSTEGINEPEV